MMLIASTMFLHQLFDYIFWTFFLVRCFVLEYEGFLFNHCRRTSASCLCHTSWIVCFPTLWYSQGGFYVCTNCDHLAYFNPLHRFLQHHTLESEDNLCNFPALYHQIFQSDWSRWLDFSWRGFSFCNRYFSGSRHNHKIFLH